MRMTKVNPLMIKFFSDFTFSEFIPSINSHEFSENGPPKIKVST